MVEFITFHVTFFLYLFILVINGQQLDEMYNTETYTYV